MMNDRNVLLHTSAEVDEVVRLLARQTDAEHFRGEVVGPTFKLIRRVRGRRPRIAVTGTVRPRAGGGSEIHATLSAPPVLWLVTVVGLLALTAVTVGLALAGKPVLPALLALVAAVPVTFLNKRLYDAEASATFQALRQAVPLDAGAQAPVARAQRVSAW